LRDVLGRSQTRTLGGRREAREQALGADGGPSARWADGRHGRCSRRLPAGYWPDDGHGTACRPVRGARVWTDVEL
jgi:hypothetical protein